MCFLSRIFAFSKTMLLGTKVWFRNIFCLENSTLSAASVHGQSLSSKLIYCLLRVYQLFLAPLYPMQCRFHPSCSHFAQVAFWRFGILKGCLLTLKRLLRCHPFGTSGWQYDPVPESFPSQEKHHV